MSVRNELNSRCALSGSANQNGTVPVQFIDVLLPHRVELASDARFLRGPDGGTILDIRGDQFHHLNPTGAVILERLLDGRSAEEVISQVARESCIEAQEVREDVRVFLNGLMERQLLRPHNEEGL